MHKTRIAVLLKNREIASIFYELADLLEIEGAVSKARAYSGAAQIIERLSEDIETIYQRGELKKIQGIRSSIASNIQEILQTGRLSYLQEVRGELSRDLRELIEIRGLGFRTILRLHKELKVGSIDELESALRQGKLRELKGFGKRSEQNILRGIRMYRIAQGNFLLGYVLPIAREIEIKLKGLRSVARIGLAGSVRRRKETVRNINIVAASREISRIISFFTQLPEVEQVLLKGKNKSTVVVSDNLQVCLDVVKVESFGSALQYLTGSREHNTKLGEVALGKNRGLTKYGLIDKATSKRITAEDEKDIYDVLGIGYIEPELRENRGEIEAAQEGKLPSLARYKEVKGDLHVHTNWSDGAHSIEEMAEAAKSLGYQYLAICDHAETLRIAHGLAEEDLLKQITEVETVMRRMEEFAVLSGIEANIDSSGKLDVRNNVLKDLDIVVASVHSGFKQHKKKMTDRILTAMHNDYVNVIGHPTGRIINRRFPYEVDLPVIFEAASELGIFMEINAFPDRLDLSDLDCQKAKNHGVKISIGTDAHAEDQLGYMELGVATARRGWLENDDVINTLSLKELIRVLSS